MYISFYTICAFRFADSTSVNGLKQIWKLNGSSISKVLFTEKPVVSFTLDPYLETADIDMDNNSFPRKLTPSRFQLYKQNASAPKNPMQLSREAERSGR
jgi:hypothetical protein